LGHALFLALRSGMGGCSSKRPAVHEPAAQPLDIKDVAPLVVDDAAGLERTPPTVPLPGIPQPMLHARSSTDLAAARSPRFAHVAADISDDGSDVVAVVRAKLVPSPTHAPLAGGGSHPKDAVVAAPGHMPDWSTGSAPIGAAAGASSAAPPSASDPASSQSSAAAAPHRTYLPDVMSGRIQSIDPNAPAMQLPSSVAEFHAQGGLEPLVAECYALLHCDYPMLALRRLCLVEKLCTDAGVVPSLRERGKADRRIEAVLKVERELEPTLAMMTDDDGWELVSSKSELSIQTFLRLLPGGRAAIKVTGVLPHGILATSAPLLHPDLYAKWLPGIGQAVELNRASNFRKLLYVRSLRIPVPFLAVRDAVVTGYGDVYSPTSVIVFLTDNEHEENEGCETEEVRAARDRLSPPGQNVRMSLRGGFCFEIVSDKETRLSASLLIDVKLKILPVVVIDWFMKVVAAQLVPMWSKQARKFEDGGPLTHLMQTPHDGATYQELLRRFDVLKASPAAAGAGPDAEAGRGGTG
jgi:hypothetical protein